MSRDPARLLGDDGAENTLATGTPPSVSREDANVNWNHAAGRNVVGTLRLAGDRASNAAAPLDNRGTAPVQYATSPQLAHNSDIVLVPEPSASALLAVAGCLSLVTQFVRRKSLLFHSPRIFTSTRLGRKPSNSP